MPELPEIQSIRRYLVASGIEGNRIERVEIGWADKNVVSSAPPCDDLLRSPYFIRRRP